MSLWTFLKGLWLGSEGVTPEPGLFACGGYARHWYKGDAVCRRCGKPNPYLKNASIEE